jgi:hypothetical protein
MIHTLTALPPSGERLEDTLLAPSMKLEYLPLLEEKIP